MTDIEINIAIAEACGWKQPDPPTLTGMMVTEHNPQLRCPPSYTTDLNAMHEAIMAQPADVRLKVNDALIQAMDPTTSYVLDRTINAKARQRAEAFLRTLGKWKD